jgi:SPP1 family predicted phage head-tail adaptor
MIDAFHPGRADRRITIQQPTETRDGVYNQVSYGWTDLATVWAELTNPVFNRSNEQEEAGKVATGRRSRFIIRYSTDVNTISEKMRILLGAETFEITDVSLRQREGYIRLEGIYKGVLT